MYTGSRKMTSTKPEKHNICAVIVTYQPDSGLEKRLNRIVKLVDRVIVIDNHSEDSTAVKIRRLSLEMKITLLLNRNNRGIATALNQGVKIALELGYNWALLFDQDSNPKENIVENLADVFMKFPEKEKLALIGSNYYDSNSGMKLYTPGDKIDTDWIEQKTVITSGTLLQLNFHKDIGRFRDEFFIDHVDHEYCLKARARGYRIILTRKPLMTHSLGEATVHKVLGRSITISNHSAFRHYYMMRNHIVLSKEYLFQEPSWVITTLFWRLIANILIIPFEKNTSTKIKYCFIGLFDGLTSNFIRVINNPTCN